MAGRKSNAVKAAEAAAKAAEAATKTEADEPKAESIKTEEKKAEEKKAEPKAATKKETAKKETVKKTTTKATAAKTTTAKTTTAKKAEKECIMHIQFAGKSYSKEDLMKIAQDVWKYDLKQKASALSSIELYVKPEECKVYYVMNGEFTGDFMI